MCSLLFPTKKPESLEINRQGALAAMTLARAQESAKQWKTKAIERRRTIETKNRHIQRLQRKAGLVASLLREKDRSIADLKAQLATASRAPAPIFKPEVRVICVMVFLVGIIPCNAVSRVLGFLASSGRIALKWIPDPSSVVNWIGRAGLGLLDRVAPMSVPWIAIIDTSISFGKSKALICLRVPLDHFVRNKRAPGLSDVECIGISVGETMNGETVKKALVGFFQKSGKPTAILKDGGSDIARGVGDYIAAQKEDEGKKNCRHR